MLYTPRTIAFLTELHHPPMPVAAAPIQRIHNRMFEQGDPLYRSFHVTREATVLSNPVERPGAVSSATFLADRIQFREELSPLTTDEFGARVRAVAEMACRELGVQILTTQVVTLRTLVNPRNYRDSRVFLREAMFGFDEEIREFAREPQLLGLRLAFPPSPQTPNAFGLRIESFQGDPRSLFLEVQGTFTPMVVGQGLGPVEENIRTTYAFIVERALEFVAHFDARQEAS